MARQSIEDKRQCLCFLMLFCQRWAPFDPKKITRGARNTDPSTKVTYTPSQAAMAQSRKSRFRRLRNSFELDPQIAIVWLAMLSFGQRYVTGDELSRLRLINRSYQNCLVNAGYFRVTEPLSRYWSFGLSLSEAPIEVPATALMWQNHRRLRYCSCSIFHQFHPCGSRTRADLLPTCLTWLEMPPANCPSRFQ